MENGEKPSKKLKKKVKSTYSQPKELGIEVDGRVIDAFALLDELIEQNVKTKPDSDS